MVWLINDNKIIGKLITSELYFKLSDISVVIGESPVNNFLEKKYTLP